MTDFHVQSMEPSDIRTGREVQPGRGPARLGPPEPPRIDAILARMPAKPLPSIDEWVKELKHYREVKK